MFKHRKIIISCIAALLALSLVLGFVSMIASATGSSSEIREEIGDLEDQAAELAAQREALEAEIEANKDKTLTIVEQKSQVDREIEITRQEVEVVNEQIRQYNLLIAERQEELLAVEADQDALFERYQQRMRAIQEQGEVSPWSVVFQSKSFVDMLNRNAMVAEIAKADQRMMAELRASAAVVVAAKEALAAEKTKVEQKKAELAEKEEDLAVKRQESDDLLAELNADRERLIEECEKYEAMEADLSDSIAKKEAELTEALRQEWLAQQQQNNNNNNNNSGDSDGDGDGDSSSSGGGSGSSGGGSGEGFLFPLPAGWGAVITSSYGYRVHPITGNYSFHNGVDLAIGQGTPIYASKSGYVTTATYNYVWGNYVTINHMDGFSTLYAHMTHYTVSSGDYVEQGEIIGYVGSTGYSTGPHLHFTIYYNGSTVNPMDYIYLQ